MNIVCAEKQELADIYQLEHALFGDHAYPLFFFRQAFDCWGKGLLVAKQDSQVAGYALMTPTDKQQEYWVLSLAVDTAYRGMGDWPFIDAAGHRNIATRFQAVAYC